MIRILGIDPGLAAGGMAVYSFSPGEVGSWAVRGIPTTGDEAQRRIDVPAVRDWLKEHQPRRAFIENVWSLPREASAFAFRYGRAIGALEATVACLGIPIVPVVPQVWKRHYGLLTPRGTERTVSEIKEASRQAALRKFPSMAAALRHKKSHGIAEAMLVAFYGAYQTSADLLTRLDFDDGVQQVCGITTEQAGEQEHEENPEQRGRRRSGLKPVQEDHGGGGFLANGTDGA